MKQNPPPSRLVIVGENDLHPLSGKKEQTSKPKTTNLDIFVATLNTRSLRTPEKLTELELAIDNIKWDIIGISEMRRFGEGIEDHNGKYILHYIGETAGLYGVGFLIKKKLARKIEEIKGINERIAVLNIKLPSHRDKEEMWTIIQAYSPTESNKKEDIIKTDKFYEDLQAAIQTSYKNLIVMGDFNGQVGTCNKGEEYTIGKHGHGQRSKNGKRLVTLAMENKLSILNSFYKKKKSKKWTWVSPNGKHKNEIDFILTNNRRLFKDVTTVNQLNFQTDHRMIRTKLSGRQVQKRRHIHNNKDRTALIFTGNNDILLNNLKNAINENTKTNHKPIQERYNSILNILKTEVRKTNEQTTESTLSSETKQLINERKELIQKEKTKQTRHKISELSKKINEHIRKDRKSKRRKTMKMFIEKTGGIKKALKELNHKKTWMPNIKTENGSSASKRQEILKIATDYYRKLYQRQKTARVEEQNLITTNSESVPIILQEEVIRAINTQKLDKAPGSDQISNEIIKYTSSVLVPSLTDLFNEILATESIPEDWTKSTIILLHKKGDKGNMSNYRPISLMSNIYKIFSKIILSRITVTLDENQPKEQAGFRSKFSTIDHIHVVRQVLQKYKEYNKVYYLGFVDFNKAFDSLEHDSIWRALECQGVEPKYIRTLENIYAKSTAQVKLERTGEEFPIERGVRQGDPISPKLFSAVLEMIFRNLQWERNGLNINGDKLNHLRFADDIVLFSETPDSLEDMLQQLSDESAKVGLSMNISKTKVMTNSAKKDIRINDGQMKIEYVNEYIYLGQLISTKDTMQKEIDRRITNSWKRYWSLSEVMKDKDMPIKEKRKIYNTCILPCLSYGCQTWALNEKQLKRIQVCQNGMERSVIGVKRRDKVRLEHIKRKTKFKNIHTVYKSLKWKWTGHMLREGIEKWTRLVTEWYPRDSKRSKGRQTKRWEDDMKKIAGPEWTRTAKDRTKWKALEEAFVERQAEKDKPATD